MACKMNGAEFKAFYTSDWGNEAFWDDYEIEVNGESIVTDYEDAKIDDTDQVRILSGVVYVDGEYGGKHVAADTFARRWLKARTISTLVVEVPNDQVDAFKSDMKSKGLRVL
jgi:hypothetical protein